MVLIQFVAYPVLFIVALCVLVSHPEVFPSAVRYIWRAKWLLGVLWFVLAFNTPGEAVESVEWMPTYEGVADANLQSVRLLITLICLAWLFSILRGERLLMGLCGLLMPLEHTGVSVSGLLVRLSLVMENLQQPARLGSWREMLMMPERDKVSRTTISFTMPPWRMRDRAVLLGFAMIIAGGVFW